MRCGIANSNCHWVREAHYWKRSALWFMGLAALNFAMAWAIALYKTVGFAH